MASSSEAALDPLVEPGTRIRKPSSNKKRPRCDNNNDSISKSCNNNTSPSSFTTILSTNPKYTKRNSYIKNGQQTSRAPWFDFYEFEAVGNALLTTASSSSSAAGGGGMPIEEAFEKVAVWRCRCPQQKLPHSIESTFALAQVLWRDGATTTTTTTTMELCLGYSAAIIRSINGLVDVLQQNRAVAASIAHLATTQLGLPLWLVNIRHEATHNQMPSLPVLRLGATTLLEYFQSTYWDPIIQQRKDYWGQAISILNDYRKTALESRRKNNSNKQSTRASDTNLKRAPSDCINDYAMGDSADDDHDGGEDDDEDLAQTGVLGTSFNRFAVLQKSKPPKKKKKTKKGTVSSKNEEDRGSSNKNGVMMEEAPLTEPPLSIARRYVKLKIPVDVAYSAAISCLVWGDSVASSPDPLLLPEEYPETAKGFQKLQKRCFPLITVIGLEWPGFVSALLVHIVDSILLTEEMAVQDGSLHNPDIRRKLFFLSSWAEYLVSTEFLTFVINRKVSTEQEEPKQDFSLLQLSKVIGYPLVSLIDRCTSSFGYNNINGSTSRRLVELFERVLCVKHEPFHGVGGSTLGVNNMSLEEKMARSAELVSNGGTNTDNLGKLTLDQMEAMLVGEGNSGGSNNTKPLTASIPVKEDVPKSAPPRAAWVRCKSWEPCAIGALPGYPL